MTDSIFLKSETFSGSPNDTLLVYTQDKNNKLFTTTCKPHHELLQVHCNLTKTKQLGGQVTNWATSMVEDSYTQEDHHILAYTTQDVYNEIFL